MIDKKKLIERYNWYQNLMTFPYDDWTNEIKMDFYFQFILFTDTVELCGYKFITECRKIDYFEKTKYLVQATDIVRIKKKNDDSA